ncbi:hypothetical protein Tco_0242673 [Tanacetum coccineum]
MEYHNFMVGKACSASDHIGSVSSHYLFVGIYMYGVVGIVDVVVLRQGRIERESILACVMRCWQRRKQELTSVREDEGIGRELKDRCGEIATYKGSPDAIEPYSHSPRLVYEMVQAVEDVVQHEPHFILEIVDNGFSSLAMRALYLLVKEKMESQSETSQTVSALKHPVLKTEEYDLWSMRIEQYLTFTDDALWEVIVNVNSVTPLHHMLVAEGPIPPKTAEQKLARKNELKAKSTLMLAILDEHLLNFHACKDAKSL